MAVPLGGAAPPLGAELVAGAVPGAVPAVAPPVAGAAVPDTFCGAPLVPLPLPWPQAVSGRPSRATAPTSRAARRADGDLCAMFHTPGSLARGDRVPTAPGAPS
ncbi:hypothetical protein TNCT6_01060 [Streptomyces sp. 6-11-2]|nr:hypothetical protein TNCT6_01060 [Streptomyces sp. 6-11-2]